MGPSLFFRRARRSFSHCADGIGCNRVRTTADGRAGGIRRQVPRTIRQPGVQTMLAFARRSVAAAFAVALLVLVNGPAARAAEGTFSQVEVLSAADNFFGGVTK